MGRDQFAHRQMRAIRSDGMTLRSLEIAMNQPEIRVRPVVRHIVTRFSSDGRGTSEAIGEFANEGYAEEVAEALKAKVAPRRFVLIEECPGVDWPLVVYAYSAEEAKLRADELLGKFDIGMRIFERPIDNDANIYAATCVTAFDSPVDAERAAAKSLKDFEAERDERIQRYRKAMTPSHQGALN